jgi:hypothetical protein
MNPENSSSGNAGVIWQLAAWLAGIAVAMALLAVAGQRSAEKNFHPNFTRFHRDLAPDTRYYPTVREMMAIAREKAAGGKILVIVGGNSILYGVGQPAGRVWTERLQRELGPAYAVVNFAMRGAGVTDFAAVVAEALRTEFPARSTWPTLRRFNPPFPTARSSTAMFSGRPRPRVFCSTTARGPTPSRKATEPVLTPLRICRSNGSAWRWIPRLASAISGTASPSGSATPPGRVSVPSAWTPSPPKQLSGPGAGHPHLSRRGSFPHRGTIQPGARLRPRRQPAGFLAG